MALPQTQEIGLGERRSGLIPMVPRAISPPQQELPGSPTHDSGAMAATKLEQLFDSMVELEGQLDRKIRKKAPFDRPLRRTADIARRAMAEGRAFP